MNRRNFVKHAVLILFLIFAMGEVWGSDFQSFQNGNWNAESTWWGESGSGREKDYPDSQTEDNAVIQYNHTITVPAGFDAEIGKLTINGGGTFICAGTLTASDEVYISGEVNLTGIINSPKITLSDGPYPGTLNVGNGGVFNLDNTVVVGAGSSLNVKAGGTIILNAWPTPAPVFEDGCIVEIGPSFPTDAATLLALKGAMDGKLLSVTITTAQTLANVGTPYDYDTITIKAGGSLTVPAGVTVNAKKLVIEGDGTSANSSDYGEMIVNGSFVANVQDASSNYIGRTINSGKLTVGTGGEFDSNYSVNEEKGVVTANGFFKSGNLHNKGTIIENDTADHSTNANCCKVVNDGEMIFGDSTRFLVYKLSDGDFDGTFTNKGKVTFGNSVHSEYSTSFTNAEDGTVEIGTNTEILFTENNGIFSNAGILTVKKDAAINKRDVQTGCTFTNTGYLIREESTIFEYTSDANTLWIENRLAAAKDYDLTSDAALVLNVAGNLNLLVDNDTSVKSLNLYSRNHGVAGTGDGKDHTITSDFKVTVKNKTASTGKLTLETISISRTSRTDGVKGTLDLSCSVEASGAIAVSSGTELDINADVSAGGITQNILSSNTTIKIGQDKIFTTSGDVIFPSNLASAGVNNHSLFSSKGTVVVQNGSTFKIDTTEGGDGGGNITFTAGGSLTANSLAGNILTVNTTAASQIFTLNSDVTFVDVILEGSSGKELSVSATKDFKLAENGGANSYASYVDFQDADHPAVYENDGTTPADVLAVDSTGAGAAGALPAGWLKGSSDFYIWNGSKNTDWTDNDNWLRKNNPNGKSGIKEIRINTKAGGNDPDITEDVTAEKFNILSGKTATVTAAKTLAFKELSGTGTLNLGKGTLKNGNADSTALDITETILSFGDGTSASTLEGEIRINELTASTGSVNIGDASNTADVTFVPGVSIGDITVGSGSKVTFTEDSSCAEFTNNGTVTSPGLPVLSISKDFIDTGIWENVQPKFTDTLNVFPMAGTGYPILWVEAPGKTVTLKDDFSFASGKGVYVNGGTLSVDSGVTITNAKNVSIEKGTLTGAGTLSLTDQLSNNGTVSISKIEFTGTTAGQINSNENGKSYNSVELKNSVTDFKVVNQSTFVDFTDNSSIVGPNVLTFSDTATITNSITGSEVSGNIKTNGTNVDVKLSKIDGTFTCSGAKTTVNKALEVTGNVTVEGTLTGNAAITVGTTLTNSGTTESKSTIRVTGNCTNTGTISDIDASNTGVLNLGSDFTDSGTTSISEIIFFGDKNHKFTNKAATQYKTVTLDSTIADARTVTVANNANIKTFTDNTARANVTFNGTAILGSITTDSHTAGKYTFTGNARVMSDTTFKPEVEFKANAAFQDNAATPAKTDATFNNKVTFSKASANVTGKNLTFIENVTANELTADAAQFVLSTKTEVPAITFTATKLTFAGTAAEIKHVTTGKTVIITGDLVSDTALTVSDPLDVSGSVTVNASKSIKGNAPVSVGTTLTNSGTITSKSTVTVNGNCTNNAAGTISDIDASNTGVLKLGSDFTDSGTTSISEIVFFGDKDHTFTNKAATIYKSVSLSYTLTADRSFTVVNDAKLTAFSDANVVEQNGKTNTVLFQKNVSFQDNGATPAKTDAAFNSKVIFSNASANVTGKNLTFNAKVTANELILDAEGLVLNTKPEVPAAGASPAIPAITFTATKLTFTGTAITVSHNDTNGNCKLDGELFSDTSVTFNNNFHVTKGVKITGGGKTVFVASGKKLFCGKDFRAQGTSASSKLTVSGDVAITSNENWTDCFAEAVFCTVKDSTVYYWNGSDYSTAEASGEKAQIPCEACTDGSNTANWIFTDISIASAKTIDDHRIELVLNDSIQNVASSTTANGVTTYTVLDCVKGDGKNPDRTTDRNGNWKNKSSPSILYSIESLAPGTGADSGKTIVIISLPADTTWNTDAALTSAGNASSTDSHGVHQTNIPDLIIDRGTGGTSEKYTVTNKWGKRFGSIDLTSTADGASPVLIAVYTGQENHTPGSTDGWDAHNFIEFVYSEEVQGVTAGDAPYTTGAAAGDPKITVDGIASFENGKLDTRNFSDNLENENLNQFYAVGTYSFRWAIASKASSGIWNGYIESITQFSGSVTIPATCVIKDRSSAKNPCIIKTGGLTVSNVKAGDPTVSNWDVIGPDFVPIRKNGEWDAAISAESNFEIVGTSSSGNAVLEKLEFHMFDNAQSFSGSDSVNWVTRNGWINASDYTLLSRDAVTGTFAADIFGGARPFEGTSAGRAGSSVSDRTAGGIRKHTLDSAYTKGAFEYQTVDAEKNVSAVHAFDNLSGDISYGFTAIVFANPDTAITRQVSDPDTLYFGLKLPTSTTELRTTYIVSYNPSIGVITDLAGNRFAGTLDGSGKRTVRSIDMTPPKMVMTAAPLGTKRLYVMFAKELQLGKLNLTNSVGQIPTEATALADIPKSLGLISLSTGDIPATIYLSKTPGEIDIDASVPAKLLFINKNYTGLEFTLTKETTLENISSLYLVVKNESAIENAKDPITGIIGNISYIQDDIGNFLPVNSAHAFSDFAVNAVMPLYAYSTSDAMDGEIMTMNLYGDEQYAVRDFSRDQQNSGTMIPGDDYTFIVKTCDEITDENQFVMIASRSPSAGSVSKTYNETSRTDRRIWLPDAFSAISSVANTNVIESAAPSAVAQGFKFEYSVNGANPVDWGSGDEITFLYEIKKDKIGTDIEICHSPVLSVNGKVNVDEKDPLYALQLDNPADLLSIDLWSFKLKTPVSQRGGVSILNNVINSLYGEKTLIKLDVPKSGSNVTVAVMTLDGNIIKYLVSDFLPGGSHYYEWDGTNLSGSPVARGMYFIRVFGDGFDETRKVMVVK